MFTQIKMKRDERGFTLIELLIVVAIIAILAAIAIPQFSAYRQRGVRASMVSDARNIATAFEAYFVDNNTYLNLNALAITSTGITTPIAVRSSGSNTVATLATANAWTITVTNSAADGGGYTSPVNMLNTGTCTWNSGQAC